jgi:siroheme synthase-like protein
MTAAESHNNLFPVFLKVESLRFLIIGGGETALEKISFMVKNSPKAKVKLVAPVISPVIRKIATSFPGLLLEYRKFREDDLDDADVVIAATGKRELNREIWELAKSKRLLVNVVDTPDMGNFYLGSIVSKGDLKIAISTNGKSPTFSKRIRELLEEVLPDTLQQAIENLSAIRRRLKGDLKYKIKILNEITSNLVVKDE